MLPEQAYKSALEKRRQLQNEARAMGVSEEYISDLVDHFYVKVRADTELGPVFENVVSGRWPVHLERMKAFWCSVALRSGIYLGKPVEAHQSLEGAKPEHFEIWMRLFEQTLRETAPNKQVVEYFMKFAHSIGARLKEFMFA